MEKRGQGFQPIGNLLPSKSNTQKAEDLKPKTSMTKKNYLETIGSTRLPPKVQKLIGMLLGGHGLSIVNDLEPAYHDPFNEPDQAKAIRHMSSELRQLNGLQLDHQELGILCEAVNKLGGNSAEVSKRELVIARIEDLLKLYPQANAGEDAYEETMEQWAEVFSEYPFYALDYACRSFWKKSKKEFAPKPHNLLTFADPIAGPYFRLEKRIGMRSTIPGVTNISYYNDRKNEGYYLT